MRGAPTAKNELGSPLKYTGKKKTRSTGQSCSKGSYSIKKEIFTVRVAKHWERLLKEAVEAHLQRFSTIEQGSVQPNTRAEIALL